MAMLKTLVFLAIINSAMATDYTVGAPNGGWDQTTDLTAWASSITFSPGDNLLFQYTSNHDVAEVSREDFDSCNTNSPLQPPFTDGSTTIALSSAGSRYFICTISGHCLGGMKVEIDTLAASAPPPTAPPVPPPQPATIPSAPSPPPSGRRTGSSPSPPPPASTAPPPSGSLLRPAPAAPSSAPKFNVMGGLTAACSVFSVIMLLSF